MTGRMMFVCPECGPRVAADEGGCCVTCGYDCRVEPYQPDPRIAECEQLRIEVDRLRRVNEQSANDISGYHVEIDQLRARQQELLRDFARVTQQIPFPDEANQVPTLIAEVGTLRSELANREGARLEAVLKWQNLIDETERLRFEIEELKAPMPIGKAPVGVDGKTLMAAIDKMRLEIFQAGITIDSTAILAEDRCDCEALRAALTEACDGWDSNARALVDPHHVDVARIAELRKLVTP